MHGIVGSEIGGDVALVRRRRFVIRIGGLLGGLDQCAAIGVGVGGGLLGGGLSLVAVCAGLGELEQLRLVGHPIHTEGLRVLLVVNVEFFYFSL